MAPSSTATDKKPITRTTRARAAKDAPTTSALGQPGGKPGGGLLSRGKEGLRMVSEKLKDKEKEKEKDKGKEKETSSRLPPASSSNQSIASLESLKAYLRIRPPPPGDAAHEPYLTVQNEREVLMRSTQTSHFNKPAHVYSFDRVFPPTPSNSQGAFFSETTLPLVEKLLHGENGLAFAYGVTNSGKTFTISGGESDGEQGLLPRAVDVVFNSIDGLQSKANIKCVGPADIIFESGKPAPLNIPLPTVASSSSEAIKLDRNYSYAIFVSCAEVYNNQIYDLLDSVMTSAAAPKRPSVAGNRFSSAFAMSSIADMASKNNNRITRRQLQAKKDPEGEGKYIAGLNEIRVQSQAEALALLQAGQSARQVFATQSNRESSRSHGIFTIKVVRIHNGAPTDPDSARVSRLSIVDLAGSERNKNTGTQGAQLKVAGEINTSLMVLSQCFQTLRSNQQKLSAATQGRKVKQDIVPFSHSKLTEIFQSFFVGDGRAVMIVNINPYDTGYEENTHIMRFSAVAREVQTTAGNKVGFHSGLKRQISTQFSNWKNAMQPGKVKLTVAPPPPTPKASTQPSTAALVSRGSDEWSIVEKEVEIEVVEEGNEEDDDSQPGDVLVERLFEELRDAREQLFEAEMRNSMIEMKVREELVKAMAEQAATMRAEHAREIEELRMASEEMANRKLDIMARFASPGDGLVCTHCERSMEDTPDQSFVSALDSTAMGAVSDGDPFVVKNPAVNQGPIKMQAYRDVREATAESEDVLSGPAAADASFDDGASTQDEEDEAEGDISQAADSEEDDDDDGTATEDEDDEETDEAEDDETFDEEMGSDGEVTSGNQADQDSSFASSASAISSSGSSFAAGSSEEEEEDEADRRTIRRSTQGRRTTGSPRKRSPIKATPKTKGQQQQGKKVSPKKRAHATATATAATTPRTPLVERSEQETGTGGDNEDDEDEIVVTKSKKKRTLGRKIVLEDDMPDPSTPILGAEVRRLAKGLKK